MIIRLKTVRLNGQNSAQLAGPGASTILDKDAEMYFFSEEEYVAARRRNKAKDEFIIPTASISYMQPFEKLECFEDAPENVAPPPDERQMTLGIVEAAQPVEDTVRMVKINGRIVERKGPPQDDELEALTKPARKIFSNDGE